jgi:TIR domain-containing protein
MSVETGPALAAGAQKVFISYRRKETPAYAGRLYDTMVARFGEDNVFMDVEMAPGIDFVQRITEVVSGCVVLIIVMGPNWAETTEEDGGRRIDNPSDFVRLEVETGLGRPEVTPIPVLVSGARMPRREDLPEEIRGIARRNAIELSDGRWSYDVGRLVATLEEILPTAAPAQPPPPVEPTSEPIPLGWRMVLEGMAVAAATAFPARLLGEKLPSGSGSRDESMAEIARHVGALALRRTETLALVGAALAFWLARRLWGTDPLRNLVRGLLTGGLAGLLGGLILGLFLYIPDPNASFHARSTADLLGLAVTGGVLGSLIGYLWRPRRAARGFLAGAIGGFLFQFLFVTVAGWKNTETLELCLSFAIATAMIAGAALLAMLLADRGENRAGLESGPS